MVVHNPLHPGLIVKDALIDNTDLTITEAADRLGVTRTTLSRLINCHAGISSEMALRLSKLFGMSIEMWINIQAQYDVWKIQQYSNDVDIDPLEDAA